MTGATKVFFICCLLHGGLCQQWAVTLPLRVEGLSGSCVVVPCSFTLPSEMNPHLDDSCKVIWKRGVGRTKVFDSSLTGASASLNVLQGRLTGNLRERNCTTILNNLPSKHSDSYYFRLECNSPLKYNFPNSVRITAQDSFPRPALDPSTLEVEEGTPVRLTCSTVAPCPALPPVLWWTPSEGDVEEDVGGKSVTSVMNFTASHLHNGQKISCNILYSRQADNSDLLYERSLTLLVKYAPMNTWISSPGRPVREGSWVNLTCNTNAYPAAGSYTWYRVAGDQVSAVGSEKRLSTNVSEAEATFYCKVSNGYGTQNSSVALIDVEFSPKDTTVMVNWTGPTVEGSSVSLLCRSRANPPVTNYTWYRDDQEDEEEEEDGPILLLSSVNTGHSGDYHCRAKNALGDDTSATVQLDVQHPPRNTSVTVDPTGPVLDGSSVALTCTSTGNPPVVNFTWFRVAARRIEAVGSGPGFTFNVTKLSGDQYFCEALNVHGAEYSEPASISVAFAPEILPSSRCIKILSNFRCTCDGRGNPLPSLVWELAGEPVDASPDITIGEVPLGIFGIRSVVSGRLDKNMPSLLCHSVNSLGSDSFAFNVSASETHLGFRAVSLLTGSALGALGMLLVCVPLLLCCRRSGGNSSLVDNQDSLVTNETNTPRADVTPAGEAALDELRGGRKPDPLNGAKVDFDKVQADAEGELGGGEFRGLASETTYAEMGLHARGCNGEDAKEEETDGNSPSGEGSGIDGPSGRWNDDSTPEEIVDTQDSGLHIPESE